jgi:DNA polymerase III subunit alpha
MTDFAHLHVHSEYSPLDGMSRPEEIIDCAVEHGQRAIALTDHGQMGGYIRFKEAAEGKPVNPIYGVEAYFVDDVNKDTKDNKKERYHLTLLAMNEVGLKNLFKIHTIAWNKNFYMKPRVDFTLLEGLNEGIIALSGCLGGAISQALIDDDAQRVDDLVVRFKSIFSDRFYLEVQPWTDSRQRKVNEGIKKLSDVYNVPIVGTIDCHYPRAEDRGFEDVFLAIGQSSSFTGTQQAELERKVLMLILSRICVTGWIICGLTVD